MGMPPVRIVKKNIDNKKEFETAIDLSDYGVTDVNDVNQLRTFVNQNANSNNQFIAKSVEYTKYRIEALSEIDKRSQKLKNAKTGKLSKVIMTGKEVDKVEGYPDVTDCFIMDNINQESKQTSANGCWSVSLSLLLQSRGVDLDQQMIRAYKPTGDIKYYEDKPMAVEDYMHLIEKVSPNTGLRSRLITSKENFARLSNIADKNSKEYRDGVAHVADNFKAVVNESLRHINSPLSITDNNHYLTVVGTGKKGGKDGFFYKDSLGPEKDDPNKTYFKTYEDYINEKLASPIPDDALKSIQCTFLQDYEIRKEKDSNAKICDQIVAFKGLKFEDGKIKPTVIGNDGKEGYGSIKEDGVTYLINEPAASGAIQGNTVAVISDDDVVETVYFPSEILEGSPYLSVEAAEQEKVVEDEFEMATTLALFRSETYSDFVKSVSDELESERFYNNVVRNNNPEVMAKLENSLNKISCGNIIKDAMLHLRDVYAYSESLKGVLPNKQPSQEEEVADAGLTVAMQSAADCIALFLRNTNESKDSEFYGEMNSLHNKLNGLVQEKTAVDAELEMYKNAYVHEHSVKLTDDLDKDIEVAEDNIASIENERIAAEAELKESEQDYAKEAGAENAAEGSANAVERNPDVDKENERLDKAMEASTNALHEYYKDLDAIEARQGVQLRSRSAFIEDGQDITTLAATNPFLSELSDDEKEKLREKGADLNNKIKQEFETLRNLQAEKDKLNKNQNIEDVNLLINDLANNVKDDKDAKKEDVLSGEPKLEQNANKGTENEKVASEKNNLAKQVKEEKANNNIAKNEASSPALKNYNKNQAKVSNINKKLGAAKKHRDTLKATKVKEGTNHKNKALSKRNDALANTSSGLLGLSQGLKRVNRKFPFFKVGRNKNSEEFQRLHDTIWGIQNKLTPNLSSKAKNNQEVDRDYVISNQFYNDIQELKESAQRYVSHISDLNERKGKPGPSSKVGKKRLALAKNVVSFCNQVSKSYEKRNALEKLSENDITKKADSYLQPYNFKKDFTNKVIDAQVRDRDEKSASNETAAYMTFKSLSGLKNRTVKGTKKVAALDATKIEEVDEADEMNEMYDGKREGGKKKAEVSNEEVEAQLKEIEKGLEKNPDNNNLIDGMIANRKSYDEKLNKFENQQKSNEVKAKKTVNISRVVVDEKNEKNRIKTNYNEMFNKKKNNIKRNSKVEADNKEKLDSKKKSFKDNLAKNNNKEVMEAVNKFLKARAEGKEKLNAIGMHTIKTNKELNKYKPKSKDDFSI